jgi:hypothetical protein
VPKEKILTRDGLRAKVEEMIQLDLPTTSTLFTILWDALADLLGTAATATLLKGAARRAAARSPELAGLVIKRDGLIYRYTCPSNWSGRSGGTPPALREFVTELRPILIELTGQLGIRHLEQFLELRGLLAPQEGDR